MPSYDAPPSCFAEAPTGTSTSASTSKSASGAPDLMDRMFFPIVTIDLRRSFRRQLSHLARCEASGFASPPHDGFAFSTDCGPPIGAPLGRREPKFTRLDDRPTGGPVALRGAAAR